MKNLLKLHEAIVIVLLSKSSRTATFEEIAEVIMKGNLFPNRKGDIELEEQIKLRASISSSRYQHLFTFQKPNTITLK